ncbi:aminodeoxychorismate synthase component I [Listeria ivanovii]|uniref:Aminodeoxychorismate synthase component I n=1 Tax=Listeria ivanovii subsp. londoniensis TaxID=202752 RepID=A0ABS1G2E6_LISIV|nr:aminodeoxychorismate synthase component I [Listeria ivanovii]AIS61108.1 aminobenzoate synthetase [Listeria ivanovii subsp. londoniensis]AIS63923.1 aminobenzoate synthetase [Listeria ivanovii subsp. londoniensis]MBK1961042.1 aminodeoxychorismate synthase component I [Listeria ivanovii subsp. londoniensis]MBK1966288.1 aminodeoxychorismate synthase component I [Listeria ivanovii subsp. londoniensis]MBK1983928.1 aminodeoxychorismate synthase component I [Listeria ivanovii subsp. londoniensis]
MSLLRFDFEGEVKIFENPLQELVANDLSEVLSVMRAAEEAQKSGKYVAGFVSYEAAPAFKQSLVTKTSDETLPLVWFGVYDHFTDAIFETEQATAISFKMDTDYSKYAKKIAAIKSEIAAGNTYQLNYTVRLKGDLPDYFSAKATYQTLQQAGKANYTAFLSTDNFQIISTSPELFFKQQGTLLTTRPMKGTVRRGKTDDADRAAHDWLMNDPKNRAENVMIVDLLRNDLGMIARPGSVKVPKLMTLEPYPTVWQMTSTVTAETLPDTSLTAIFKALFPCGSITGAPKAKTMEIISALEDSPRGVYCGAIGYLEPNGNAIFNVPIRTISITNKKATYGVGGGIVWDSDTESEFSEIHAKSAILKNQATFSLIECLRLENGQLARLASHLERLEKSAHHFGFPINRKEMEQQWRKIAENQPTGTHKFRVLLHSDGSTKFELTEISAKSSPITASLASKPVLANDPFLYHKTTNRTIYNNLKNTHTDETLLWNENGELTEFINGNIVLGIKNHLLTPPLSSGLLPGTMRASLLAEKKIFEQTLTKRDLLEADFVWLINSVRGFVAVEIKR